MLQILWAEGVPDHNGQGRCVMHSYDETKAFSDAGSLDDSIFNYLDDDVAMSDFIRKNSTRKWLYSSC